MAGCRQLITPADYDTADASWCQLIDISFRHAIITTR